MYHQNANLSGPDGPRPQAKPLLTQLARPKHGDTGR
jgi:hypothetical protein